MESSINILKNNSSNPIRARKNFYKLSDIINGSRVMEVYKNYSGNSGITFFDVGKDFIDIIFRNDFVYKYNNLKPGKQKVEAMKRLAQKGKGLSTFISQKVRNNYFSKTRIKK